MKNNRVIPALFFAILSINLQAEVTLHTASYQEQVELLNSGEKRKKWIRAEKIIPGTVIRYVNTLNNKSHQPATKLLIKNTIPENMEYLANTAGCASSCRVLFSVDGGKHFKNPSELFVGRGENRHLAKSSEYTNIEWILRRLDRRSKSHVEYKARLK